ncbi:replicative DNA helicase [Mariprofundus sp. KV]|uniref:replicative DNA helicase n=1 Tax=Mariprofundus sp. KV TaxID=2608715 RepID=UPI00321FE94D
MYFSSFDAERAVLGRIMLDAEALERLEGSLQPEHFYVEPNAQIFHVIQELAARGQPVDAFTIKDHLEQRDELASIGGEAYLADLVTSAPSSINVKYYADLVRERSAMRDLLSVCSGVFRDAYEETDRDVNEHLDMAESNILAIAEKFNRSRPFFAKMSDLMLQSYKELEDRFASKEVVTGITTGFEELDEMTSGLQRGELIIIAGQPGMGRSSLLMNLAANAALRAKGDDSGVVASFSLDNSSQEIAMRMLAREARVDMQSLKTGRFTPDDWRALAAASGSLAESKIHIGDNTAISVMEIRSKCRRLKRENRGLDLILIDDLQLMIAQEGSAEDEQEISRIMKSLKKLAKELNVPVIVLSRFNYDLDRPTPLDCRRVMSKIKEHSAVERNADVLMFVCSDNEGEEQAKAEVVIAKQRNGPVGRVTLNFARKYLRFDSQQ